MYIYGEKEHCFEAGWLRHHSILSLKQTKETSSGLGIPFVGTMMKIVLHRLLHYAIKKNRYGFIFRNHTPRKTFTRDTLFHTDALPGWTYLSQQRKESLRIVLFIFNHRIVSFKSWPIWKESVLSFKFIPSASFP